MKTLPNIVPHPVVDTAIMKSPAQEKLEKFVTKNPKVKFDDGSEEEHKLVKDKGALANFVKWVLSL